MKQKSFVINNFVQFEELSFLCQYTHSSVQIANGGTSQCSLAIPLPLFFFACGKSPQVVRIQRMVEGTLGSVKRRWEHEMSITVQNNYGVRDVIL